MLSCFSCVWLFATPWATVLMVCRLSDSFVHGILQARILEWVAISSSMGSSQSVDWTHISSVSCIDRPVPYLQQHLGSPYSKQDIIIKVRYFITIFKIKFLPNCNVTFIFIIYYSSMKIDSIAHHSFNTWNQELIFPFSQYSAST